MRWTPRWSPLRSRSNFRSMRTPPLPAAALAWLIAATTAHAQKLVPSTTGMNVAATATLARTSAESQGASSSAMRFAPRVDVSYGVSPRVSLLGALAARGGAFTGNDYRVRSVDMGLRYLGYAGRTLRPFAEGGLSVRKFTIDVAAGTLDATDVGPWAAAGYMWFPGGPLAIEAAAQYGRVNFSSWRSAGTAIQAQPVVNQDVGARVGARWYFRAR